MQTKVAVVYEYNRRVTVDTLTQTHTNAGEAPLSMAAASVCHSDRSMVSCTIVHEPLMALSHEGAGIVERVGDG